MAYGESNSHVNDDVRWPWPELSISKTAGDSDSVPRTTIGNGIRGIKWSRDRRRHVTQKVKLVTPIRLEPNISKTAGDAV